VPRVPATARSILAPTFRASGRREKKQKGEEATAKGRKRGEGWLARPASAAGLMRQALGGLYYERLAPFNLVQRARTLPSVIPISSTRSAPSASRAVTK
jgi:hypothetical protein